MQYFDLANLPHAPWKNGSGSTQEIACWPPDAGLDTFDWRVSVATIAAPGPFSCFPGVDRQIMLLSGPGVDLAQREGAWRHRLDQRWSPWPFAGDDAVDCTLLGGPSTDFNLMVRRGRWRGSVEVVDTPQSPRPDSAGVALVLHGDWVVRGTGMDARTFTAGQGLVWHPGAAWAGLVPLALSDGDGGGRVVQAAAAPRLAWVALTTIAAGASTPRM